MEKTKRRGFTIVELVIVIAVIAILAAVLIPTFTSLIDKANLSSDIQAVRQMNMVLAAASAVEEPADFAAVCDILGEAGYDDETGMRPVSEHHRFFWHSEQNEIFLAKIIDDKQVATVVFPEDHEVLTFESYDKYKELLGKKVFDLAYPGDGYASTDIAVTGISLDKTEITLDVGNTATLTATVAPADATNQNVTWSSSDDTVATVGQNGLVTAVASGTATITVTTEDGRHTATCEVTVAEETVWTEVATNRQLREALAQGGNYRLSQGFDLSKYHIETNAEKGTVLDLNGQTLQMNVATLGNSCIDVNKSLKIVGGTLEITGSGANEAASGDHGGIYVAQGGTLTLENVTVNHQGGICLQNHGNLTIKDCKFTGKNQTINNGGEDENGKPIPATLYIENTEFDIDAPNETPWPVISNRQGSTVTFGDNVKITGTLLTNYYGAFLNEAGPNNITGTPSINVTYLQSVESPYH